ncbi:glycosyltransferase (plasmid) [Sphingobium limneticum]|jgi:hypothetical protein
MEKSILIQNYHPQGTKALIRDFKNIGFRVFSPDSDWGRIGYFAENNGLGGEIISFEDYMRTSPGFVLIGCKAQEEDLKSIANIHSDKIVLNIAQQHHVYEDGISDVLICPDIALWRSYPGNIDHRLLYFPRPIIEYVPVKDVRQSFESRTIASYISIPTFWKRGLPAFETFREQWSGSGNCYMFGHEAADGMLTPADCNARMATSFFTVHFKDDEAYGLSCLESMMLGTPIVSTHEFMQEKTLGEYFLRPDNSIVTDTIEEAIAALNALTLSEYQKMSHNARATVLDLTSDERTIQPLRRAMDAVIHSS